MDSTCSHSNTELLVFQETDYSGKKTMIEFVAA